MQNGLNTLKNESSYPKQEKLLKTNWKSPGRDGVQSFWIKKLTNLYDRIAEQLNEMLDVNQQLPEWMTFSKTVLCQKDKAKGNAVDIYRPISCIPIMWKLLIQVL